MTHLYKLLCADAFDTVTGGQIERWMCDEHLIHYALLSNDSYRYLDFDSMVHVYAMLMGGYSIDATNSIPAGYSSSVMLESVQRDYLTTF